MKFANVPAATDPAPAPVVRAFEAASTITNEPAVDTTAGWVSVSSDGAIRSMVRSASLRACGYERVCAATPDNPDPRQPAYVVLSHASGAILGDWTRDGIVLRDGHGGDTIGRLTPAYVRGGKLGGDKIVWGTSERAQVIMRDVESGVRRNISVEGDWSDADLVLDGERDGIPVIRASRWTPLAAAVVDVPADPTVGVARSIDATAEQTTGTKVETPPAAPAIIKRTKAMSETTAPTLDPKQVVEITSLARDYDVPQAQVNEHILAGKGLDEFRGIVLRDFAKQKAENDAKRAVESAAVARKIEGVGSTVPAEKLAQFSLMRAIIGLARSMNPSLDLPKVDDGLEREISGEQVRLIRANPEGRNYVPRGFCVPWDLVRANSGGAVNREFNIAGTGSAVIAQALRPELFIDYLRAKLVLAKLGVTTLTGLVGDVLIPKQTSTASGSWVDETTAVSSSDMATKQIKVSPKTCGAFTNISRQLLLQSTPSAEMLVMNDLVESLARTIQTAGFHGLGSANQPTGLLVALANGLSTEGADQGAVTEATVSSDGTPTYAEVEALLAAVEEANVDGTFKWAMRPAAFRQFKTLGRVGTTGFVPAAQETSGKKYVADLECETTTSLTSKYAVAGRWDAMVLAMWGALDLTLDPYSLSTRGALRVVALQSVDFGYRYLPAFGWSSKFKASA